MRLGRYLTQLTAKSETSSATDISTSCYCLGTFRHFVTPNFSPSETNVPTTPLFANEVNRRRTTYRC